MTLQAIIFLFIGHVAGTEASEVRGSRGGGRERSQRGAMVGLSGEALRSLGMGMTFTQ